MWLAKEIILMKWEGGDTYMNKELWYRIISLLRKKRCKGKTPGYTVYLSSDSCPSTFLTFLPYFCFHVMASFTCQLSWAVLPNCLAAQQYAHYYDSSSVINITIFRLQRRFTLCEPHLILLKPKDKGSYPSIKNSGSKSQHRECIRMPSLPEDCKPKDTHPCLYF